MDKETASGSGESLESGPPAPHNKVSLTIRRRAWGAPRLPKSSSSDTNPDSNASSSKSYETREQENIDCSAHAPKEEQNLVGTDQGIARSSDDNHDRDIFDASSSDDESEQPGPGDSAPVLQMLDADDKSQSQGNAYGGQMVYAAMFSKPSTRKHRTWEEDGFLIISGSSVTLKNTEGKVIESGLKAELELRQENISDCKPFRLGSKDVQIQEELAKTPFNE